MKNKEIISTVVNSLRALNVDDRISKRYVLSILRYYTSVFVRRENDQLRLWNYQDLWTTVSCVEMEDSSEQDCCTIKINKCRKYSRSKKQLPQIYSYTGGMLIKEVASIDGSVNFIKTTQTQYRDILNREFVNRNNKYYWVENQHLVIPNSEVKMVSIVAYFKCVSESLRLGACNKNTEELRVREAIPLEEEFNCPNHLLQIVIDSTLQNLMTYYKRIVMDELPNLDNNVKSQQQISQI